MMSANGNAGAERNIFPGVGHTPPIKAPEMLSEMLVDFLERC